MFANNLWQGKKFVGVTRSSIIVAWAPCLQEVAHQSARNLTREMGYRSDLGQPSRANWCSAGKASGTFRTNSRMGGEPTMRKGSYSEELVVH